MTCIYILRDIHVRNSNSSLAYFFCRHDVRKPESAYHTRFLRSPAVVHNPVPAGSIRRTYRPRSSRPGFEGIVNLLRYTLPPTYRAYVVLDGLDECDEHQKTYLLRHLQQLQSLFSLFICLSFRPEADHVLKWRLEQFAQLASSRFLRRTLISQPSFV